MLFCFHAAGGRRSFRVRMAFKRVLFRSMLSCGERERKKKKWKRKCSSSKSGAESVVKSDRVGNFPEAGKSLLGFCYFVCTVVSAENFFCCFKVTLSSIAKNATSKCPILNHNKCPLNSLPSHRAKPSTHQKTGEKSIHEN